jgi:hypothetical protein
MLATIGGAAFMLGLCPGKAMAWGDEGHEIVVLIAAHYMRPQVLATLNAMLAADRTNDLTPHDIASEATWADKFRASSRQAKAQTAQWHFVDIEVAAPDEAAACFGRSALGAGQPAFPGLARDCVVDKVEEFRAELTDAATAPSERLLALRFLLHLVGDLHQPLHSSDDNDRGGNDKRLETPVSGARNLHAFWDTAAVAALGRDPREVAAALISHVTTAQQAAWSGGTAANWARESFEMAKADAYGRLPPPDADGRYELDASYQAMASGDVAVQLSKAGIRLAAVLDKAISGSL